MNWLIRYFFQTLSLLCGFVITCFTIALVHWGFTGEGFGISWRWIHDSTLLPTNFVLIPTIAALFLVHAFTKNLKALDLLAQLPRIAHYTIYLLISLFLVNSISQASGGCIWFVFTEGWWVRYGHGWVLTDGSIIPEWIVASVYVFFALLSLAGDLWFYKRYIWRKPKTKDKTPIPSLVSV